MSSIYHVSIHKAASTWFRDLFRHPIMKRAHGMPVYHYEVDLKHKTYEDYRDQTLVQFPKDSVVTNIYCSYDQYLKQGKWSDHKGFYIYKDPREIVISSYWCWKLNHPSGHPNRVKIDSLSFENGLLWTINELADRLGKFDALRSWASHPDPDFKYWNTETFFEEGNEAGHLLELLDFLGLDLTGEDFDTLCREFSFEALSGGRSKGEQDKAKHFRSGKTGTWREMPEVAIDYFYERTGDLVEVLGYER